MRVASLAAWAVSCLLCVGCAPSGCESYAGWDTYEDPDGLFTVRYLSPPWTVCSGTEFEADCRECPSAILGRQTCGGGARFAVLWVEPALLDPEFLLIPSYKLEVSWYGGDANPLDVAERELSAMEREGMSVVREPLPVSFVDGGLGAEVRYEGPVHIITGESAVARPDEREYRVVYTTSNGRVFRLALDSAIDAWAPEAGDMLGSFSTAVADEDE